VNGSIRLQLRVTPGAARTGVVGRHGEAWKIKVAAAPEGGRANDAVVRFLARTAGVGRDDVTIVAGRSGRDKIVKLAGIEAGELDRRLAAAAGETGLTS